MVIGDRFAWGHVPKTGGEATRSMFGLFPELVRFSDPRGSAEQHATFREREMQIEGKALSLNIRRLPAWILSREHHKARWGLHPDYQPTAMDSPAQMAESSFPDHRLSTYLEDGRFRIDRWLRMESLADDFIGFISEFTEIDPDRRKRVFELGEVNANPYDHEISHWFTNEQVASLYENNPVWTAVEIDVYGALMLGSGR
jgi:hypothetical protein